jgi:hypothetical protein
MKLASNLNCCSRFRLVALAVFAGAGVLLPQSSSAHGMGHSHGGHGGSASTALNTGVDVDGTDPLAVAPLEVEEQGIWGASLSTFWESKHVHYGVTEADGSSVYGTELSVGFENFSLTASGIFALENDWTEWNFTASYTAELGPVFIAPGFNLRWSPYSHDHGHDEHHDEESSHDDHDHEDHHAHHGDKHEDHVHREFGYELFIVVGTTAIPYVIPSVGFLWDLADGSGGFMEFRLDGDIPLYRDIVSLSPYASLGLNFGYNTQEYYGWNNFQYGANVNVAVTRNITVFGGVGQNVVMQAAREVGSTNEVVATAGVAFSF